MSKVLSCLNRRVVSIHAVSLLVLPTILSGCAPSAPKEMNAASVVEALKLSGLPIGSVTVFDSATDPNKLLGRPGYYTSKVNFIDTRHLVSDATESGDNTIEVFATLETATARKTYVEAVTKGTPMLAQYIYQNGTIVMRLQKEMLPEQAVAYEAALKVAK